MVVNTGFVMDWGMVVAVVVISRGVAGALPVIRIEAADYRFKKVIEH